MLWGALDCIMFVHREMSAFWCLLYYFTTRCSVALGSYLFSAAAGYSRCLGKTVTKERAQQMLANQGVMRDITVQLQQ